jgi:ABC-type multidrug transport system ATPase subunit
MGPSGSGKTSLLNTLAGRVPIVHKGDALHGRVLVNGKAAKSFSLLPGDSGGYEMAKVSAYVMQDDNLFALSTVNETLLFAARLRLPRYRLACATPAQRCSLAQHAAQSV